MQISILLMEQIFELFLMILMGFIIVKAGIVKEEDSKVLSKIVLYLIIPCVIINAFQVDYTKKTVNGLLIALAASVKHPFLSQNECHDRNNQIAGVGVIDRSCFHFI